MNNTVMTGRLTKDPVLRKVDVGGVETSVLNFYIAVDESHDKYNKTEFCYVTAWRGLAETIAKYMKKGDQIGVVGAVHTHAYVDKKNKPVTTLAIPRPVYTEFLGGRVVNDIPEDAITGPTDDCPFDD